MQARYLSKTIYLEKKLFLKFCNIAKKHVGETFDKVPEATDILKAIDVIEKHCS